MRLLLAFEIANGGQVSIVNRLDRETSGLVLVAKTSAVARKFGLLMERRQLRKEYLAIVSGWPRGLATPRAEALGFGRDSGIDAVVEAFIEDDLPAQKQLAG